VLSGMLCLSE